MAEPADVTSFLASLGAGEIPHPGGTLLAHLRRTASILESWSAGTDLVLAGLCHAVYGTDAFRTQLLDVDDRDELRKWIGVPAEEIVYVYGSCDRDHFAWRPLMRDRFTGIESQPSSELFTSFVELTAANELDVVQVNEEFAAAHGEAIARHMATVLPWMTDRARRAWAARHPAPFLEGTHVWFENNSGWAPPDPETLAEWVADGVCRCPDECLVRPEAWCQHGLASWWLILQALEHED